MIKVFSKKYVFAAIAVFLLIGGGLVFSKAKAKKNTILLLSKEKP